MNTNPTRREALRAGAAGLIAGGLRVTNQPVAIADDPAPSRPFLTPADDFTDVSRGNPVPHTLSGQQLVDARLTEDSWRLEIEAEDKAELEQPLRIADGSAITFATLRDLGNDLGVCFLKAMQCNNIALPLGQGLWEGVRLRDVLARCGKVTNARRLFYWGFHNDDDKQMFRSSLAMNQVLDTAPGDLPPFIAYRLNGAPIPLERGGPVRMVVPWAHGFKSVKWLQKIVVTNSYTANDTYALANNDPESYLKTAAYFDDEMPAQAAAGKPLTIGGTAMVGWPGLERVEYWLRPGTGEPAQLPDDDPELRAAIWRPAQIDPPPADWSVGLPANVPPSRIWGFSPEGRPKEWPMRFSIAHWTITLDPLPAGSYELRVRTVDENGFAQPQPRPSQRSGRNLIPSKTILVS